MITDCYNIAVRYLINTYGVRSKEFTSNFRDKLRKAHSKKDYLELIKNATDVDYIVLPNKATDTDGREIELLLSQYYYGWCVRYELQSKLRQLLCAR